MGKNLIEIETVRELENQLLKGDKNILYFWGDWCSPCRDMNPDIDKISASNYVLENNIYVLKMEILPRHPFCQDGNKENFFNYSKNLFKEENAAIPAIIRVEGKTVIDGFKGQVPLKKLDKFIRKSWVLE